MQSLAGSSQEAADLYIGQSWAQTNKTESAESEIILDNRLNSHNKNIGDIPSCSADQNIIENSGQQHFDILKELIALHRELGQLTSEYPDLHPQSFILETLVRKHRLNTMILKLNPGNKGYCFLFKILKKNLDTTDSYMANVNQESELLFETKCWAYEDDDLLQYIDDGHLPTCIIDVIETNYPNLFYSNFIITEIWDYRQSYGNLVCDINYTLLRPSIQSIIVDVASLTSNGEWSSKEKLALEAEIIKASAPPLCLDPDPIHGELAITAQHTSQIFNTRSIKRKARKFSQVGINRKRKLIQYTQYHGPDLCASIARNQKSSPSNCKKYKQTNEIYMPAPSLDLPELSVPSNIDVFRYVKDENASFMQNEDLLKQINHEESQLIEEYIFNIYKKEGLVCIDNIKLCILQRLINLELYGELTVEYYQKDGIKNYRSCEFVLGTRAQANRFYDEFKEIVTDEGKECVQITHIEPGKESVVTYTDALKRIAYKALSPSNLQVPRPSQQLMDNALLNQTLLNSRSNLDNSSGLPTTSPGAKASSSLISSLSGNSNFIINNANSSEINSDISNTIVQSNNLVNNSVVYKNYIGLVPTSTISSDRQYSNISGNKPIAMNVNQNNMNSTVPFLALRNQVTIRPPAQDASGAPVPGQSVLAGQQHQATPQTIPRRPGDQLIEKLRVVHRELAMQQRLTKNINVNLKDISYLLQQLVAKEKIGTMIFTLHGSGKGFVISAFPKNHVHNYSVCDSLEGAESVRWPYQESDLINILERDEFAPILIRLAAQKFPHLIQDNCLIAEVRDFREGVLKHKFHLLKPDMVKLHNFQRQKAAMQQQVAAATAAAAAAANEIRKSPLTTGQNATPASAAISAIKNNVRNWAEQYQQETAAAAAAAAAVAAASSHKSPATGSSFVNASTSGSTSSGNDAAIISLLNSAPAAMTNTHHQHLQQHQQLAGNATGKTRTAVFPQRRVCVSPAGNVVVADVTDSTLSPSFSLPAGFQATVLSPSDTSPAAQQSQTPPASTILERMIANASPSKKVSPGATQFRTPSTIHAANLNLAGRQQFAQRIGVSGAAGAILPQLTQTNAVAGTASATSVATPFATGQTVLLNTTGGGTTQLPMSLAQLVASGVKGLNTQSMRGVPSGIVSFNQTSGPPLQLLEALRRPSAPLQSTAAKPQLTRNATGKCQLTGAIIKMSVPNTASVSHATPVATMTSGGTILALTPQQLAEVQVTKDQQPKGTLNQSSSMLFDSKHRRRSHTNDSS